MCENSACCFQLKFFVSSHRALANGISLSGSAFGTIFVAPLYNFVNELYGWRIAVRMLSGCLFLTLVCAASYRFVLVLV